MSVLEKDLRANEACKSIAIIGSRNRLWPIAATLVNQLPHHVCLTLVEDPSDVSENRCAAIPYSMSSDALHYVKADEIVKKCKGTYQLGVEYFGLTAKENPFFAAYSGKLPMINSVPLHQIILGLAYSQGMPENFSALYAPFRFCARTAMAGKFSFPENAENSPISMLGPKLFFDWQNYAEFLKSRFKAKGVSIIESRPVSLSHSSDSSAVKSMVLENGEEVFADFFINASLASKKLFGKFRSKTDLNLSSLLPFDGYALRRTSHNQDQSTVSIRARDWGVSFKSTLSDGVINEALFVSSDLKQQNCNSDTDWLSEAVSFQPYLNPEPWHENVVELGCASFKLGPFWQLDYQILSHQLNILSKHLPVSKSMQYEATAFNRLNRVLVEEMRDFVLLPLFLNQHASEIWRHIRSATIPDSLALRIQQFKSRGRFVQYEGTYIDDQLWIDTLIGFGVVPKRYSPLVEMFDMSQLKPILDGMTSDFTRIIEGLPAHSHPYSGY